MKKIGTLRLAVYDEEKNICHFVTDDVEQYFNTDRYRGEPEPVNDERLTPDDLAREVSEVVSKVRKAYGLPSLPPWMVRAVPLD